MRQRERQGIGIFGLVVLEIMEFNKVDEHDKNIWIGTLNIIRVPFRGPRTTLPS